MPHPPSTPTYLLFLSRKFGRALLECPTAELEHGTALSGGALQVNVMGLLQLSQATQPFYSYSLGIDAAFRRPDMRSPDALATFVRGVLHATIGPADGVASGVAFRAARAGDARELPELLAVMNSNRLPREMQLASLQMGHRLWGMSRRRQWSEPIHDQYDSLLEPSELHHAVAFGTLISETTSNQVRAIATYLLNIATSLVNAAVKTIPLDEAAGDHVLAAVHPTITALAATCADKHPADIGPLLPPQWQH